MFEFQDVKFKDILNIKNMHISSGKVTSIIGESGSGKTTLIKMLNKMNSPSEGKILYKGKDLREINSVQLRREVIMLAQNPVAYEGTIRDNLMVGLNFTGKPPVSDSILKDFIKRSGLIKNLDDPIENLSGGELQRIALIRILVMNPEVFLLDEPSSALDDETEKLIINMVVSYIRENNKTMVMVTHSKSMAEEFSDEIIKLEKNKIFDGGAI
ncbi:MAG: ABC transporter ATP-binding protein [Peptoniphilus sp.]|nr:ABC transporter ATP-binding protein [Peptoniphilus sp.]